MIFKGTWLDGTGHPFDPASKQLQAWTGGGAACIRRRGLRRTQAHDRFVAAARYMADRWLNELSQAARDSWDVEAATGPARRGTLSRSPSNGYIMLNAYDFVQLYADPPSTVAIAGGDAYDITTTSIDTVTVGAQTVTFTATCETGWADYWHARLATYQVHPRAVLRSNPWRATRLIDLATNMDFAADTYTPTVPLAWPVQAGDTVRLYWRSRFGHWWKYHDDDSIVA